MNTLSFDIGSFSTKVSYMIPNINQTLKTKEYKNIVLFKNKKEIIIGENARKIILNNLEEHKNNYVVNFIRLLNMDSETFFNKKEQFYTFAEISEQNDFEIFIEKKQNSITPFEILFLFLKEILTDLKKNFFYEKDIFDFKINILTTQNCLLQKKIKIRQIFEKIGLKNKINFYLKSLSLAYLHAKMNNFIINKRVLFIDIGYTEILMSIVKINHEEIFLENEKVLNLGIRDFDYQMYLQILRDLSEKYNVDYKFDKNIKFKILSKMNKLKRSFKLKKKCVIELEKIFGEDFVNKNISFDQKSYEKQNSVNFLKFRELFNKNFEKISNFDNLIQDCQIVGGGSKIKKFVNIILKNLEVKFIYNKLSYNYSGSKGALLKNEISADIFYFNNIAVKYKIIQLKKIKENDLKEDFEKFVIKDEYFFKENEKINSKQNEKIIDYIKTDVNNHIVKFSFKNKTKEEYIFEINDKFEKLKVHYYSPQEINFITLIPGDEIYHPKTKQIKNQNPKLKNAITQENPEKTQKKTCEEPKNTCKSHKNCKKVPKTVKTGQNIKITNTPCKKNPNSHNCESHLSHSTSKTKKNPLVNATYLHIYSDLLQDILLFFLAIAMSYKPSLKILDPIISIIISITVLFFVIRYSLNLCEKLMDKIPCEINFNEILNEILEIEGVEEVHDLHVREIGDKRYEGSVHCIVSSEKVLKMVTLVFRKFGVFHSTVQVEWVDGKNDEMYVNCDNNVDC